MCKNELLQSSGTKNELHAKFRNKNNSLTKNIFYQNKQIINQCTHPQCHGAQIFCHLVYSLPNGRGLKRNGKNLNKKKLCQH